MTPLACHFDDLAERQHGAAAGWQLAHLGLDRGQIDVAMRGRRRVFRDVGALGDLDELGWYMAAALAYGPTAAISHSSALMLLGLRPSKPGDIHVSHWPRDKLVVEVDGWQHHREHVPFNRDRYRGLVHLARGWQAVRVSADHVHDEPALVVSALRQTTGW